MKENRFDIILIGGSAGSIEVISAILKALPKKFHPAIVLVIHRMKNTTSRMDKLLSRDTGIKHIIEPEDKEPIKPGTIYLAPQNYHLLVEKDRSFSLDYSELVNFSRPSIDVSFESAAGVFGKKTLAVLLSGANKDGAEGLAKVIKNKGSALIQSPATAHYPAMPNAAIEMNSKALVKTPEQIVSCILDNSINQTN
jgi:two-component system chemotaxis response regulator CheB